MSKSIVAITLCIILPLVVIAQGVSYDRETLDLFAQFPKSDALDSIAHSHAYQEGLTRSKLVLYSSWFLNGNPRLAMQTRINTDGQVDRVRTVFDWADQAATNSQLTTDEQNSLLAAIKELPNSTQSIPVEFIVAVTFQQDGKWRTRLYDRRTPPNELIRIYKLAHSVMDSK